MRSVNDEQRIPRRHPGPKPRGRTVVPVQTTITPDQRAALEALADAQECSISAIIRQMIDTGLALPVPAQSDDKDA
jgi:hypothetical protein